MTLPQQQPVQPQSQHFLLKWNNHRSNMVSVFDSLLQSENLVDVTLAVEGQFLKGHKIVLSACSPYFESMFVNQTPGEKHPILIFHDMKFSHLKTLLDFMYRGEISIDEKDLSDVLKVAEALSIRGLSSFESDDEDSDKSGSDANGNAEPTASTQPSPAAVTPLASSQSGGNFSANSSNCNGSNAPSNTSGYHTFSGNSASSSINHNNNNASDSINSNNSSQASASNQDNHSSVSGSGNNCDANMNGNAVTSKGSHKSATSARGQKKAGGGAREGGNNSFASSTVPPPPVSNAGVKRRRGRPIKKETLPTPSRASTYKQPSSAEKFHASRHDVKPSLTSRQKVRRRIPKQFGINSGTSSRIKLDRGSSESGRASNRHNAALQDDEDMETDFLAPDADGATGLLPTDICNSEPLSEMSVRGLDLFKYASIENGVYRCTECEKLCIPKTFKNKYSFQRHAFLYHEGNMRKVFPCPVCSREFSRPDKMKNHLRSVHEGRKNSRHNNSDTQSHDPPASNEPQGSSTGDSSDFNDKCDV